MIKKITTQRFSIGLIIIGITIIILTIFPFSSGNSNTINSTKIAQFGDFIGGVVGSIFSLAGVILFYIALKEQREDFKTNTKVLVLQKEELKLQREELMETRKVFEKQSNIMSEQQNDNTFFNLLSNHRHLVESFKEGKLKFGHGKTMSERFQNSRTEIVSGYKTLENIAEEWKEFFSIFSESYKNKCILNLKLHNYENYDKLRDSMPSTVILFRELIHVHKFIDMKFEINNENNSDFYKETLHRSLTQSEVFIFEAIYNNYPNEREGVKYNPSYYKRHKYIDFEKSELPAVMVEHSTKAFESPSFRIVHNSLIVDIQMIVYSIEKNNHLEIIDVVNIELTEFEKVKSVNLKFCDCLFRSNLDIIKYPILNEDSIKNKEIAYKVKLYNGEHGDVDFCFKYYFDYSSRGEGAETKFEISNTKFKEFTFDNYSSLNKAISNYKSSI